MVLKHFLDEKSELKVVFLKIFKLVFKSLYRGEKENYSAE